MVFHKKLKTTKLSTPKTSNSIVLDIWQTARQWRLEGFCMTFEARLNENLYFIISAPFAIFATNLNIKQY
jgi:hypothetical protein